MMKGKLPNINFSINMEMMFFREMEALLMMTSTLFLLCVLFGAVPVVKGTVYYDSSNYKIINDVAKCRGNLSSKILCKILFMYLNFTGILQNIFLSLWLNKIELYRPW